jgi:hypothetical protein
MAFIKCLLYPGATRNSDSAQVIHSFIYLVVLMFELGAF